MLKLARCRPQAEGGFALIELLISMTVLVVGMFALLATFTSGYTTLDRADVKGSATMLADRTMESYRGQAVHRYRRRHDHTTYTGVTNPPSPDGRTYNVNSVVTSTAATNTTGANARAIKVVVVTVADAAGKNWVTERSTFEALSG